MNTNKGISLSLVLDIQIKYFHSFSPDAFFSTGTDPTQLRIALLKDNSAPIASHLACYYHHPI